MPRPIRPYTWGVPVLALAAALPPAALHGAFAAAAAGLFEAAPFVLASALLPRSRLSRLGPVLGCGCGGLLPAALSLPSVALCWFAFGPVPAALRVVAAALLAIRAGRRGAHAGPVPTADPLADLSALGIAAFAAALAGEGLRAIARPAASPPAALLALAVGLAAGALAPCGTTGIGAAMALRSASPFAAAGLLVTSGMFAWRRSPNAFETRDARGAFALLALACTMLAVRGTHGFLNPRLWFVAPLGAAGAAACALRGTGSATRPAYLVPSILAVALVTGSPVPPAPRATIPYELYPGRNVEFTGAIAPPVRGGATTLVRFAILCCRADAEPLSLELDRRVNAPTGSWFTVRGVAIRRAASQALHVESIQAIAPPADPFLYL
jgi:hypothetical protein